MKSLWLKKADRDLDRIVGYICTHFSKELADLVVYKIKESVLHLESFPELGRKIGGHFHKRYLVVQGNTIMYEIVLNRTPVIIVRSIRPRKEFTAK